MKDIEDLAHGHAARLMARDARRDGGVERVEIGLVDGPELIAAAVASLLSAWSD